MNGENTVCVDGNFLPARKASVPALGDGLLYGQGIFETVLVKEGQPVFLEHHLKRLCSSALQLSIALHFAPDEIEHMVQEIIKKNGLASAAVQITLLAGTETGQSILLIHSRPLPYAPEHYRRGFTADFISFPKNERSPLANHKVTGRFENMLARREAASRGLDEGFFINTRGEVAEGTVSNIFIVRDGTVITPDTASGLLPGIVRRAVLETCVKLGIATEERKVFPEEMRFCDEVFITNSLMGVMPVTRVSALKVGKGVPGEITQLLRREIFLANKPEE